MTTLERLALQVSARLTGDDLVLVLDYAAALTRETRVTALREAMAALEAIAEIKSLRARYVEITHGAYQGLYRRSPE